MGLDTTHGCFRGSYSGFQRLRKSIARACGGAYGPFDEEYDATFLAAIRKEGNIPDHSKWYYETKVVPVEYREGMDIFLCHSDCDGKIVPEDAVKIAVFLRWVAPLVEATDTQYPGTKSIGGAVLQFAEGCEWAASLNEPVLFQ